MSKQRFFIIKDNMDFVLSLVILLITLPFALLVSLILTVLLKSSPLIIQERGITEDNRIFNIYKFKTIKPYTIVNNTNNEDILYKRHLSEYVPVFCKWLRKSGLDELPQLINVLKGEMSLIGPRPLMISDLEILRRNYPEFYQKRQSIKVKPGITGLWQVRGDRSQGIENLLHLDLQYDDTVSASLDFKILLATIPLVIRGKHSDAIISGMTKTINFNPTKNFQIT